MRMLILSILLAVAACGPPPGYRGIWFELGKQYPYGDKYSGGLATYTAKHMPLAIYAPEADKTFFVYGGTRAQRRLQAMVGVYDHNERRLEPPRLAYDKQGVDDPHDNPSLMIDDAGHLHVFVSGRSTHRPGIKLRSRRPYDATAFDTLSQEEFTYPQIWNTPRGYVHFFTKYTGRRELYFERSEDGIHWTEDRKLAGIAERTGEQSGHYQVSGATDDGRVIGTFFNRHPDGHVDGRTDLYYMQSTDGGTTWTAAGGIPLDIPLDGLNSPARAIDYASQGLNVYMKDLRYDSLGRPWGLYLTSGGPGPGPDNAPYSLRLTYYRDGRWHTETVCTMDHDYDMGSLFRYDGNWAVVVPGGTPPQAYAQGGELELWQRRGDGADIRWVKTRQLTHDSPRNHGYVRRVVNGRAPFEFFWADGDPMEFGPSYLYFGDLGGNVYPMPYRMRRPVPLVRLR